MRSYIMLLVSPTTVCLLSTLLYYIFWADVQTRKYIIVSQCVMEYLMGSCKTEKSLRSKARIVIFFGFSSVTEDN